MNYPSQEDLLGYVLGALDAQEQRDLQQEIDQNPELEEQLLAIKASLAPLDCLETSGARPGLARRTCEAVAAWDTQSADVARRLAFLNQLDQPLEEQQLPQETSRIEALNDRAVDQDVHRVASTEPDSVTRALNPKSNQNKNDMQEPPVAELAPKARASKSVMSAERHFLSPMSWSISDVLVGVASLAILFSLLFPALSWQRYRSRLLTCQNNLRQVGTAFMLYSSQHGGRFVSIPESGNLAAAGCFGPILKSSGYLEDDSLLACAGVASDVPVMIPSVEQVEAAQTMKEITHYQRVMGGHFGHNMGHVEGSGYAAPRLATSGSVVLLSDRPSIDKPGRVSNNHGGKGQNCLFADGRTQFVVGPSFGEDALFENDYGVVAPGSSETDNVIAPSHLSPNRGLELQRDK